MHTYTYLWVWLLLLLLSPFPTSGDDDLDPLAKKHGSKFASFFLPPPEGGGDDGAGTLGAKRLKCARGLEGKDFSYTCPQYVRGPDDTIICAVGACYVMETSRKDYVERGCFCTPNPDLVNKCVTLSRADPEGNDLRMCWCDGRKLGCCNMHRPYFRPEDDYKKNLTDYISDYDHCHNYNDYEDQKKKGSTYPTRVTRDQGAKILESSLGHSFQPSAKSIFLGLISLVFLKALFYQA